MNFVVNLIKNAVFFVGIFFTIILLGARGNDVIMAARGKNRYESSDSHVR